MVLKRIAYQCRGQHRLSQVGTFASVTFGTVAGCAVSKEQLLASHDIGGGLEGVMLGDLLLVDRLGGQEQEQGERNNDAQQFGHLQMQE